MRMNEIFHKLPETNKGVLVVLSGGMDSSISARLATFKYGCDKVHAITFDYGQKQSAEILSARKVADKLGIPHQIADLSVLGTISQGFSANVDRNIAMPTIKEVLGDPQPKTYVPNRNMTMLSIAAAYAEVHNLEYIICGLQVHDEYGYHDTTQAFVDSLNSALIQNRKNKIQIIAPFSQLSKKDEISLLQEMDGNVDLLALTLTCYNPDEEGRSCGKCPSCSERINAFMELKMTDPIPYSVSIPWRTS